MPIDIVTAAMHLLAARKDRSWLSALPDHAKPQTIEQAYAVQHAVAAQLGAVAGWKVGAPSPTALPQAAPLHSDTIFVSGMRIPSSMFNVIGVEGEVGYTLGKNLRPREKPYSREEILDAISTMHPMIEIADTRFTGLTVSEKLSHFADQSGHGALIVGPAMEDWQAIDAPSLMVRVTINGEVTTEKVGGNSAGDPIRLIQWLADEGAVPFGGLKEGQVITTGSCTGCPIHAAPIDIKVEFPGLGVVTTNIY